MNDLLARFMSNYKIGKAIYWDDKCGQFRARAYSATTIEIKANEAFNKFKIEQNTVKT